MPDYSKSKIYKLVNSTSDDCYYGSTCNELYKRKGDHKGAFNRWKNGKNSFITSFQLFEENEDNVDIILVEEFPCKNKQQLHARERWWIENNQCLNKFIPGRSGSEYYLDNKDKILEHRQQYYLDNKDKILERKQKYYLDNKEKISKLKQQYYLDNKDKILKKMKQKINCDCGSTVCKADLQKHNRTLKHQKYLEKISSD